LARWRPRWLWRAAFSPLRPQERLPLRAHLLSRYGHQRVESFADHAAVAGALCIPVGYHIRMKNEGPAAVAAVAQVENGTARPAKGAAEFGRAAPFSPSGAASRYHGTNLEAMPNIYREITGFKDSLRRQGFRAALMAEWVQLNPTNAMAGFRDRTIDASQRGSSSKNGSRATPSRR